MASIIENVHRIAIAKSAIRKAIIDKGVEVADTAKIEEYPALVEAIPAGGGGASAKILNQLRGKISLNDEQFEGLGFSSLDVHEVEDMSNLFDGCLNMKKPDFTAWNVGNVKNMSLIFQGCAQLASIIGTYTQEDVDNGLEVLKGLSVPLDVSTTKMEAPSICAIIRGMATIEPESAMLNMTIDQYNAVQAVEGTDYIAMAKSKGWLIGRGGRSDEALAEETAGTIIGKNASGEIIYVKYEDFIKDDFDTTTFTPVAVLAIPRSHTKDGKCRGVSLMNMAIATPEQGSTAAPTMVWGVQGSDEKLTNFSSATTGNVPVGDTLGVTVNPYLPTDRLSTTPSVVDTVGGVVQSYYATNTPFMPSPYMADGRPNPQYWEGSSANKIQCNTDMDGEGNTQLIIDVIAQSSASGVLVEGSGAISNSQSNYPPFACCYRYRGGGLSGWYLPACGEEGYYVVRWGTINDSLTAIRAKYGTSAAALTASGACHWTSTEYYTNNARSVMPSTGYVNGTNKNNNYVARAFRAFP